MGKLHLVPQKHHLENAKLDRKGKKPMSKNIQQFRIPKFEIFEDELALWLRIKALEEQK